MDKKENVIYLNNLQEMDGTWTENAEEFTEQVRNQEVTHGVMIYRTRNGNVHWRVFNTESGTYILGLLERLKFLLNTGATVGE